MGRFECKAYWHFWHCCCRSRSAPGPPPSRWPVWAVILGLTAVLAVSQFVWLAAGAGIKPLLKSETALRIQSRVFGVLLLLVAAFMLLRPG